MEEEELNRTAFIGGGTQKIFLEKTHGLNI